MNDPNHYAEEYNAVEKEPKGIRLNRYIANAGILAFAGPGHR